MKILLAVDGSEPSLTADLASSGSLSLPPAPTVELLTVIPDPPWTYGPWPASAPIQPPADLDRTSPKSAPGSTTSQPNRPLMAEPSAPWFATVVRHPRIVLEADRFGADLMVVGARGHSAVERFLLGSVSSEVVDQALARCSSCARPASARILLATDGSGDGDLAAAFVRTLPIFGDPAVKVLSVVDPGMPWWAGMSPVDGDGRGRRLCHGRGCGGRNVREKSRPRPRTAWASTHVLAEWRRDRGRGRFDHRR